MRGAVLVLLLLLAAAPLAAAQSVPQGPAFLHRSVTGDATTTATFTWWLLNADAETAVTLEANGSSVSAPGVLQTGPAPGFWYAATVEGLAPGTEYTLQVTGGGNAALMDGVALPTGEWPLRFAALGDMGIKEQSRKAVDALQALAPEFVLHAGDISYAEGNEQTWQVWHDMVQPLAGRVPYMTAIGNHETYTAAPVGTHLATRQETPHTPETRSYLQRFTLPSNELWYSFDWGGLHVVALDTFASDFAEGSAQWTWLKDDLEAARNATWTIAFLHEPLYSTNSHGSSLDVRAAFEPLFEANGVDLVIQAHDHGYERTHGMRGSAIVEQGPNYTAGTGTIYVTTGGGGESLYDSWSEEPWSAVHAARFHVLFVNATAEALEVTAVPTDGQGPLDAFRIASAPAAPLDPPATPAGEPAAIPAVPLLGAAAALVAVALSRTRRT